MLSTIVALALVFSYFSVVAPVQQYYREKNHLRFKDAYQRFKTRTVRKYYADVLADLSCSEIERRYDVDDAYNRLTLDRNSYLSERHL